MAAKEQKKKEKKKQNKSVQAGGRQRIRWEKLDNTSLLFPAIAGESMTSVYRISVVLTEEIRPELLQQALDMVLPKMDGFNLRLRRGMFWFYFEENGKPAPKVTEEAFFPCRYIRQNKNRSYLFRVTYFECKINLEVFHVLTDGMGGLNFLKELVYQYLRLAHPKLRDLAGDGLSEYTSLNREDSFIRNYRQGKPSGFETQKAYLIRREKLPNGEFGVMHGSMSVPALKELTHRLGVSINEYLVAVFVWSVYVECLHKMPDKRPIRVAVPVNLRPYFDSVTTKNFFIMVSAEFAPADREYPFEKILEIVKESLRSQITKEHMEDLFSYSVARQQNIFLRPIPLAVKNFVMKMVYTKSALANTSTITNIGNVRVEDTYAPYIEAFHAFIAMSKGQEIKGTICSYRDTLVFSFSSIYADAAIQGTFFRKIAEDGVEVSIETNGVYYE